MLVDQGTFLQRLGELFQSNKGSTWLTHKRLIHDGGDVSMKRTESNVDDTQDYPCLVRVTDGKDIKFSTQIGSGQLQKFYTAYGGLLKSSMTVALRKRDKKREKQRAEQATRRKQRATEPVAVEGPKRGNRRKRRQRRIKKALKQEESRRRFEAREEIKKG